ncbi:MAG: RluA family pseudouridine synthase [Erysipelotrichaceae bacterium]|nr:RluA family pseudouridine synthase [Erysipelotrichaceae bacterium]
MNKKNEKQYKKSNKVELSENKLTILKTFKVHKEEELLEFLYEHITNDSKNNIKRLLANHQVLVNGAATTQFNFKVYKEDVIQISKNAILKQNKAKIKLDIIYEDDELIVINKPSGLLSIESDNEKSNTAYRILTDYVQEKDKKARIFIVHRIDKDTSGVLLVAKNEKIKNALQHHWQDIVISREYIAICEGKFSLKEGTVRSYLKTNVNNLMYSTNDHRGQLAITHYKVMKENNKYSLVDVHIDTGRKNQIRVHMGDLNHKIVGDNKYGPVSNPINRLGLHAYILEFIHPISKKKMTFKAKIPSCFESLFK